MNRTLAVASQAGGYHVDEHVNHVASDVTCRRGCQFHEPGNVACHHWVMQDVVLTIENSSLDDVESLSDWLLHEPELRGCVRPRTRPPAPGEMGPVIDAIAI